MTKRGVKSLQDLTKEIKPGMLFMGNKNGRIVKILNANAYTVTYRDTKYGTVFTLGRETFNRCDIREITETPPDDG